MGAQTQSSQPLGNIDPLKFLTAADLDYVAARSLMLSGLVLPGNAKAAEAVEKILKTLLICIAGALTGDVPPRHDLIRYQHRVGDLLAELEQQLAEHGLELLNGSDGSEVKQYVASLEDAYKWRYPDAWPTEMHIEGDVGRLDAVYLWLRDNAAVRLPVEQQERGRRLFGTWRDAYNPDVIDVIHRNEARDPFQLLKLRNALIADAYSIA